VAGFILGTKLEASPSGSCGTIAVGHRMAPDASPCLFQFLPRLSPAADEKRRDGTGRPCAAFPSCLRNSICMHGTILSLPTLNALCQHVHQTTQPRTQVAKDQVSPGKEAPLSEAEVRAALASGKRLFAAPAAAWLCPARALAAGTRARMSTARAHTQHHAPGCS
jgi:hypothetical protein